MAAAAARTGRAQPVRRSALIALVVVAILVFLGFTKDIPFTRAVRGQGRLPVGQLDPHDSPVRIAGVNVGKVKSVEAPAGHRTPPS